MNLYVYCANNPVKYYDPSGYSKVDAHENKKDLSNGTESQKLLTGPTIESESQKLLTGPTSSSQVEPKADLPSSGDSKVDFYVTPNREVIPADKYDGGNHSGAGKTKTYQTYTKTNPTTGEVYSGRTSGTGTPAENVAKRDSNHHMNDKGFGPAVIDKTSSNKDAIRGREQLLIESNGGAKSQGGKSGNAINGIGHSNKKKEIYIKAAQEEFK